jgi:hypothetical protein
MKNLMLILFFGLIFMFSSFGQNTATHKNLTVWIDQGWIIKAKNEHTNQVSCKISWTTVGRNAAGEEVSREEVEEPYYNITVGGKEERRIITTPQDPKKEIFYTFENIKILVQSYQEVWTRQDEILFLEKMAEEKMKAKQNQKP